MQVCMKKNHQNKQPCNSTKEKATMHGIRRYIFSFCNFLAIVKSNQIKNIFSFNYYIINHNIRVPYNICN